MSDTKTQVLLLKDIDRHELCRLLARYGLSLHISESGTDIPGSFWGDEEAGLIENQLHARLDTPIHSILHESCHYICMDQQRRIKLHTNAGGNADEENAVCYLQILLSNELKLINSDKMMRDMDTWGYSFRLGSTNAWFEADAEDARQWLLKHQLIDKDSGISFNLRDGVANNNCAP